MKSFLEITKNIVHDDPTVLVNEDINFIKEYVNYAEDLNVDFPKELEKEVVDFIEHLKGREEEFLVTVGPRMVIGFIRLCKANARLNLRNNVTINDVRKLKKILDSSLSIRKK